MRVSGVVLVTLQCLAAPLWGAGPTHWDAWFQGHVAVSVRSEPGGEGAVLRTASDGVLEFEATESAYLMVVAVDAVGEMHLLFPRYWNDDGWVRRGSVQRLRVADFASSGNPWNGTGVVHVEVIASPTPFAWERLGLRRVRGGCRWMVDGRVMRVGGDPYRAFNRLHRRLFPRWDDAVFVVDDTWFFVGTACEVPGWIRARHPVVHRNGAAGGVSVRVRWDWDFGARCARPVYRTRVSPAPVRRVHVTRHTPADRGRRSEVRLRRAMHRQVEVDPRIERKQRALHRAVVQRGRHHPSAATEKRITKREHDVKRTRREPVERRRIR